MRSIWIVYSTAPRPESMMGKVREAWSGHLGIDHDGLRLVARTLAISRRLESGADLRERLNDRFPAVGMRRVPPSETGFFYDDLIRKLHAQGRNTFDAASFRDLVADEGLLAPAQPRPKTLGVRSFMHPIDDIEARSDESVNLVSHFDGRHIRDQAGWKADVFPELSRFLIQSARDKDQLRLILDTHVSLAFGVGANLNVKSGKAIEIEQRAGGRHIWSATDKPRDPAWPTLSIVEETVHASGLDLAVAVSLTHDVAPAVRCYAHDRKPRGRPVLPKRAIRQPCGGDGFVLTGRDTRFGQGWAAPCPSLHRGAERLRILSGPEPSCDRTRFDLRVGFRWPARRRLQRGPRAAVVR